MSKYYRSIKLCVGIVSATNAILLGYSGVFHLGSIERFAVSVGLYDMFPYFLTVIAALMIATLMIYSAILFWVCGAQAGLLCSLLVWGCLSVAVVTTYLRGIDIDCGCSMADGKLNEISVLKVLVLFIVSLIGYFASKLVCSREVSMQADVVQ